MSTISQSTIQELIYDTSGECISIYMPTHSQAGVGREDSIRLHNILKRLSRNQSSKPVKSLIGELRLLADNEPFLRQPGSGLALFYSKEHQLRIRSDKSFREIALVGSSFFIHPLLSLVCENINFTVLAISQNAVRILECDIYGYAEKKIDSLPQNLEEALWYRATERRGRRQGPESGSSHGQAEDVRQPNVEISEFAHAIDRALQPHLKTADHPLILAGTEPLKGIFRKISHYQHIASQDIRGNPDHKSCQELHQQAVQIAKLIARQKMAEDITDLGHTLGKDPHRITLDPIQIIKSARSGRVRTLMFSDHPHSPIYMFDENVASQAGTWIYEDLVDQAARHTLLSGGQVYAIPNENPTSILAAVLRY